MIDCRMNAQLVKVCSMGLKPNHLGKTITELQPHFKQLEGQFGFNVCGEGGEYESAVFDCPLFLTQRIVCRKQEVVHHDENPISPVAYLLYQDLDVEDKPEEDIIRDAAIMNAMKNKFSMFTT